MSDDIQKDLRDLVLALQVHAGIRPLEGLSDEQKKQVASGLIIANVQFIRESRRDSE